MACDKCGCITVLERSHKEVCFNCLVQEVVRKEMEEEVASDV
jgi:hypothetical protein